MKSYLITEEARRRKRERIIMATAMVLILLFSFFQYYLLSNAAPLPFSSNVLIFSVININILLILVLIFLIVRNLVKLIFEDKKKVLGARLRTKMVIAFVSLSLIPTAVLFVVAFQFLNTSISYWFDVKVESSLENAITIGRTYYSHQKEQLVRTAQEFGRVIERKCMGMEGVASLDCVSDILNPVAGGTDYACTFSSIPVHSVQFLGKDGTEFVSVFKVPIKKYPDAVPSDILARAAQTGHVISITDKVKDGELIRAIVPLKSGSKKITAFLVAGNLLPGDMLAMLDRVRQGYEDYSQLRLFQNPIKTTLLLTLFLITVLIIFVAIWFGFRLARGITEPVQLLADGVRRVALGDLDFRIDVRGSDELSSLVNAFNTMTSDLKEARNRAEQASRELMQSYRELENRRRYVEILLQNVNAGVIALDKRGTVTTMNLAAERILGRSATEIVGSNYSKLLNRNQIRAFEGIREELARSNRGTVQRPVRMKSGNRELSLVVNFTMLYDSEGETLGLIIVFDDLTELEKIQRLAAWREVARRIAHEVKNPLTPIQLSAQRLRKKYIQGMDDGQREIFEKCTDTIIKQVEEIRRLVDEFSRFARMPAPRFISTDIRKITEDLITVYEQSNPEITFSVHSTRDEIIADVDPDQYRRVLLNLFDNALSAMDENGTLHVTLNINQSMAGEEVVTITVADTGRGISPADMDRLFNPYFSRRRGGTGLGLAIVNSIVSDHNGTIKVSRNSPKGTVFTIVLPLKQDRTEMDSAA